MLTTSGKGQKPVALPFKRDQDGPTFVLRFIPPNRWIFEQGENNGQQIWEKFSSDVLMIQNKVKIDSANVRPDAAQADPAIRTNPDPFKPSAPAPAAAVDSSKIPNVGFDTLQRLAAARPPEPLTQPGQAANGSFEPAAAGTAAPTAPQQQSNFFESWIPGDDDSATETQAEATVGDEIEMPPSVELDPLASEDIMNLLKDPATGFTSFSAFTFFLIREIIRLEVSSSPLAIVVFEFAHTQSGKPVEYSKTEIESIAAHLANLCSTLHIASRLESGEFVVLLADQNAQGASAFAAALRQIFEADDLLLRLSTQPLALLIGIATAPHATTDPGTLIAAAQQSKEVARHTGDPFVVFS
jgi:GGDEF domain-containing protein